MRKNKNWQNWNVTKIKDQHTCYVNIECSISATTLDITPYYSVSIYGQVFYLSKLHACHIWNVHWKDFCPITKAGLFKNSVFASPPSCYKRLFKIRLNF